MGLGVFGLLAATITIFQVFRYMLADLERAQLKLFSFWWEKYQLNLKRYWRSSVVVCLLGLVLTANYTILDLQTSFLTYWLFYLTLFLFAFGFLVFLWFSFLSAYHPEKSQKEILKNAVAYPTAFAVEMIVLLVFSVAAYLIVWPLSPGLVVFAGIGAGFAGWHWFFKQLYDSDGRYRLKKY